MVHGEQESGQLGSVHTASFPALLQQLGISLAVTTYQAGKLVLLRSQAGQLNTHFCSFPKPMGLATPKSAMIVPSRCCGATSRIVASIPVSP